MSQMEQHHGVDLSAGDASHANKPATVYGENIIGGIHHVSNGEMNQMQSFVPGMRNFVLLYYINLIHNYRITPCVYK